MKIITKENEVVVKLIGNFKLQSAKTIEEVPVREICWNLETRVVELRGIQGFINNYQPNFFILSTSTGQNYNKPESKTSLRIIEEIDEETRDCVLYLVGLSVNRYDVISIDEFNIIGETDSIGRMGVLKHVIL